MRFNVWFLCGLGLIRSKPQRAFVQEQVLWSATAQDFSSGTVQPSFNYEWFGDTGSNESPGNATKFSTTYDEAGVHIASFSASVAQTDSVICKSLWVHELKVNAPDNKLSVKVGEPIELAVEVFPVSIESKGITWQCNAGEKSLEFKNNKFIHSFEMQGNYDVVIVADIQGKKIFKTIKVDVSE